MERYNSKGEKLIYSHGTWMTLKEEAEILDRIEFLQENTY